MHIQRNTPIFFFVALFFLVACDAQNYTVTITDANQEEVATLHIDAETPAADTGSAESASSDAVAPTAEAQPASEQQGEAQQGTAQNAAQDAAQNTETESADSVEADAGSNNSSAAQEAEVVAVSDAGTGTETADPQPEQSEPADPTPVPDTAETDPDPGGTQYTLIFKEDEINAMISQALAASGADYVATKSISLQDGTIAQYSTYSIPAGRIVEGVLAVKVWAANGDVQVLVVQGTIGQFNMTDARKAAVSAAFANALESEMAQAHDYTYVDSITIANGVMTVLYH
ncbi:MAG: hypothetical protein ACE5E7_13565 [Anaerolineae bacterium]